MPCNGPSGHEHAHHPGGYGDVCQVCPVCAFLRLVSDARPELVEHLSEAARHLTLAAKAVIEVQLAAFERPEDRFERINLDES